MNTSHATSSTPDPQEMRLHFDANLPTVEGILAMVQEWCTEQGIPRDDVLSVRLVLEELLTNICLHADLPPHNDKVDLQLQLERAPVFHPERRARPRGGQGMVHIALSDAGPPFNPLAQAMNPRHDLTEPPGGQGLTLVRLMASAMHYQRTHEGNRLHLSVPLSHGGEQGGERQTHHSASSPHSPLKGLRYLWRGTVADMLRSIWYSSVAVRQTMFFTLSSMLLIWGAMALYSIEIADQRNENARQLVRQAMHMQATISTAFVTRVANSLEQLSKTVQSLPQAETLLAHPDELFHQLQERAALRSLRREFPVIGIVYGYGDKAWLYNMRQGTQAERVEDELYKQPLIGDLTPLVAQNGKSARWEPLFMTLQPDDPHASMVYATALASSGKAEDGWIGVIITMPWITDTLYAVSGFTHAVPFYTDSTGRYIIFPPGRALWQGPQRLSEEPGTTGSGTLPSSSPLTDVEADMLAGNNNAVQLRPLLHGDATPWKLSWQGPTTLAYYPMMIKGWQLGLLISSDELGNAPRPLPSALFYMALLGPLCVGLITWVVTSHTLRPLKGLADALQRFGSGDMSAPFPKARYADEIGDMLTTFERVRVTMRASLRNLVDSAAAQQRMQNELSLARSIQESMLPAVFPRLGWVEVDARIDMSREVCGDLYDCFSPHTEPQRLCCVIGDVCGKGVPAAIIMSRIMSLAHSFLQSGDSPAQTLEKLNAALLRSDASSMFVTMLVGILETDGCFRWASAGHPPPPLRSPAPRLPMDPLAPVEPLTSREQADPSGGFDPEPVTPLPWPGELVLGVRKEQRYSTFITKLVPGQSLLLYTDGADEAMDQSAGEDGNTDGEIYGEARLAASFDRACRANCPPEDGTNERTTPQCITIQVREDLIRHMGSLSPADDISLMALTFRGNLL